MRSTPTIAELHRYIARLRLQLDREGWVASEEQLRALVAVLPITDDVPDAAIVTETEAAFVLGDSLLVASWQESDEHLVTDLFSLPGTMLTVVWNPDWLADDALRDVDEVPENRPMTVTFRAPNGAAYVLPFDAAWTNPTGCINFASILIFKAHGFRPAVGTDLEDPLHRTWKR